MAKKEKKSQKKNPADLTLRNLRALRSDLRDLGRRVHKLEKAFRKVSK